MNWVIMPYRNAAELTRQAVEDVMAQMPLQVRLLLIDNGSGQEGRDLGAEAMQRWPGDVIVWHHDPPLPSLAATWNLALRFVWRLGGEHAWVVNNDVRLPRHLYADLQDTLKQTGAWFVTATNVTGDLWYPGRMQQSSFITPEFLASRGGPDFSCFLITQECHRWFQFDEGFIPAYHEDNDYHRRLQLAGLGDRIFSVCAPYAHLGSGTLKSDSALAKDWARKFEACQRYYVEKWGGLPGQETHTLPFNRLTEEFSQEHRWHYTGQGRPGSTLISLEPAPWADHLTT